MKLSDVSPNSPAVILWVFEHLLATWMSKWKRRSILPTERVMIPPLHVKKKRKKERNNEYIQPAGSSIFLLCHISLSILLSLEKNVMSGETIISYQPLWKSRHLKLFHWLGAFVYFCQINRLYKTVFWTWYEALEACAQMKHLLLVERASYSLCFDHCSWAENQWA